MSPDLAAVALSTGDLPLGGGLLALLRPALERLAPGGVVAVLSTAPALEAELAGWCRLEHHAYRGGERLPDGSWRHLVARGPWRPRLGEAAGAGRAAHAARFSSDEALALAPMPARAESSTGFAPRGAWVEPGGPAYPFSLLERDRLAPPEIAQLYDQAVGAQWDAGRDIPWDKVKPLPPALERALGQVMTFLAENELSALYVPARWLPRIHPAFVEVAMFLSSQLADEARHIDVFLKRARACGELGTSSVTTSQSLLGLLACEDFTEASFLLSVLGEGTFLDLLRFIEDHAPDEVTEAIARRARADEARHVHFGLAHVKHALAHDGGLYSRLEAAVRRRAASMAGASGVPAPLQDALTVLAAGGTDPRSIARGHRAFRALLEAMNDGRIKRLCSAGFTRAQAEELSRLHTPNFM